MAVVLGAGPLAARAEDACSVTQGLAAEDAGRLRDALAVFECVSRKAPGDWRAINSVAGLHGKLGEPDAEIAWASRAAGMAPREALPLINLGNGLAAKGEATKAEAAFTRATELDPRSPLGPYSLAALAEQAGDAAKAERLYRRSLQLDPSFEDGSVSLAALLANQRRFSEAEPLLQGVLARNPRAGDAAEMLAHIRRERR